VSVIDAVLPLGRVVNDYWNESGSLSGSEEPRPSSFTSVAAMTAWSDPALSTGGRLLGEAQPTSVQRSVQVNSRACLEPPRESCHP